MMKIFIDPGHGGTDPGAAGNGLQEKNITLSIASRLRDILLNEYSDVSIMMSRTADTTVSLTERTNAGNLWGADFYLSIHINSGGGTGYEDYIYPGSGAPASTYQRVIHEEVMKVVAFSDRGMKSANFHVLRETQMPALLTENGFIDHVHDAAKLENSPFIENIARGHVNGIARAFSLEKKTTTLYKVQIGAFSSKNNADVLAADAEAKGYDAYTAFDGGCYKVQIGAFSSKENADALAERASLAGFDAIVVVY
ncbi:N-acetylmuramoyl-L-alanine amidase [Peribacillus deserti]|uniref:N-acetylmuramoyl-L-alanine amidase n=1 Tax=Peribacillus deserti TaxID=673318 RepID=A0A2N5M8N3_9BACI|nr:N-acetylmuramoyl-L-alanine amidase [Peribacillus deserti]PLT30707.1 N-acetylmuramoyl-L-alanine amidase [Peribacillus deserti]